MAAPVQGTDTMIATRKAFGDALAALGDKYKNLVVLDADLSNSTQSQIFGKKFPERFFTMGIAEQDLVDTSAGFAMAGKLPFACSFAIFLTGIGWQQIRNGICYPNLNVKLIGSHGGIQLGEDGATHQALEDFAVMRVIPNMKVFCPADAVETKQIIEAIANDYGPTYVRLARMPTPVLYDQNYKFQIGKGSILLESKNVGSENVGSFDIGIIAVGALVAPALEAAKMLQQDGHSVRVINMASIKPIDEDLVVETAGKVKLLVTAEDHQTVGGLAGAVADVLCDKAFESNAFKRTFELTFKRIGMRDRFGESGKSVDLYRKYGFDKEGIYKSVSVWWAEIK